MGFTDNFIGLLKKKNFFVNCCGNDKFEIWNIGDDKNNGFVKFDAFRNVIRFSGDLSKYHQDKKDAIKHLIFDIYERSRIAYPG